MRKILEFLKLKKEKEPARCEMHCLICMQRCCLNCYYSECSQEVVGPHIIPPEVKIRVRCRIKLATRGLHPKNQPLLLNCQDWKPQ